MPKKISFPSRNDRRVGTRATSRSSPSRRRLARASVSRARAIDDDVILPSFPSPFSSSFPSRAPSRRVPTPHRHLDTVPRSVGRAGDADAISRRRRKAPAGVVVARGAHRATTRTRREDDEEDVDERLPPRVARAESFARPSSRSRVISTSECHPPRAHTRERRAGHPFDARASSVVRRRRGASRERKEKNGRSSRTSLAGLARSLVRSRARDDVRGNDRARRAFRLVESARRFASFFYTCAWIPR